MSDIPAISPDDYPEHIVQPLRWSDVGGEGVMSHCGIARSFEDARVRLIATAAGRAALSDDLAGFLVRIYIETFDSVAYPATLTTATGSRWVGNSSYCSATALFADDRLIARGEAVNVCIKDGRPAPVKDEHREALLSYALPDAGYLKAAGTPLKLDTVPGEPWHHVQRIVRFSDTDALGHVNNVSVIRFYEDALHELVVNCLGGDARFRVVSSDVSYQAEALLHGRLGVATAIVRCDGSRVDLRQHAYQQGKVVGAHTVSIDIADAENFGDIAGAFRAHSIQSLG